MANREKYTHRKARDEHTEINYIGEANRLIKGLSKLQLYELYEICREKLTVGISQKRENELKAVMTVIEGQKHLDPINLHKIRRGRSEMAKDARAKDGNTTVNRKKV
jgi:hypothetical protein